MSTERQCSETTISDAISDNETNSTIPNPSPSSEDCVQNRGLKKEGTNDNANPEEKNEQIISDSLIDNSDAIGSSKSKNFIISRLQNAEITTTDEEVREEINKPDCSGNNDSVLTKTSDIPGSIFRGPALKREKSHTDTVERKKKRVKFSDLADEIIANISSPISHITDKPSFSNENKCENTTFSTKLKKLLQRTTKKCKLNTEDTTIIIDAENIHKSIVSQDSFQTTNENIDTNICENESAKNCENRVVENSFNANTHLDIDYIDSNLTIYPGEESTDYENLISCQLGENGIINSKDSISSLNKLELKDQKSEDSDDTSSTSSAPKREGTFTFDESPPSKIVKSCSENYLTESQNMSELHKTQEIKDDNQFSEISSITNQNLEKENESIESISAAQKKCVAFLIDSEQDLPNSNNQLTNPDKRSSILKRQRPTSFEDEFSLLENEKLKDGTSSPSPLSSISTSSETVQSCIPRPSYSNISNTAKRTFTSALKNVLSRQDSMELKKTVNTNKCGEKRSKNSPQVDNIEIKNSLVNKRKLNQNEKTAINKNEGNKSSIWTWKSESTEKQVKEAEKIQKSSKQNEKEEDKSKQPSKQSKTENQEKSTKSKSKNNLSVSRPSSWSGVPISVPHVKRDNTFMKVDAKKYDSEKERLQNEVVKLSVEKDRLICEVSEIKTKHDEEVANRKILKRSFDLKFRQTKEEEIKRHELHISDLRNRFEDEKRSALSHQKDIMVRSYDTEILRNNRGRDEETRRLLGEARLTVERLQTSLRREALKEPSTNNVNCQHHSSERELERLTRELATTKEHKKKLEETIQGQQLAERTRVGEIRRIHEQHENQVSKILKSSKQEATRLLEEIKSKDRSIGSLEKKINLQDAKIRQQDEKQQRDVMRDESGRKQLSRNSSTPTNSVKDIKSPTPREDFEQTTNQDVSLDEKEVDTPFSDSSLNIEPNKVISLIKEVSNFRCEQEVDDGGEMAASTEITRLKKIVDEQQQQISSLIQQSIERENPSHLQLQVWPQKRESCMKASDLPTVPEQVSDEPKDDIDRLRVPVVQPFRRSISLMAPSSHNQKVNQVDWNREARLSSLEATNASLEAELQEARDHADLLEFRILEFTEVEEKNVRVSTVDRGTATYDDIHQLTLLQEDLSLPLSIDSGLDLSTDTKARISEGKVWLGQLSKLATQNTDKTAAHSLAALLEWVAGFHPISPSQHGSPTPMSPTAVNTIIRMGAEDHSGITGGDLTLLAARLQETLTDPQAQETALVDTIAKLRVLDSSLGGLQSRVHTLTEENRELQDALAALHEAHETRTEASGTESEIVHRKTPSIQSDLSDAESDSDHHHHHHHHHLLHSSSPPISRHNTKLITNSTSFQESGIFDSSCDFVNAATQTNNKSLDFTSSILGDSDDTVNDTSDVDLKSAVARLATIRSVVQDRDLRSIRLNDLQECDEYLKNSSLDDDRVILTKVEYDSIVATERQLQHRLDLLKADREALECQCQELQQQLKITNNRISSDSEETMRGELNVISQRLEVSERCRRELFEEKCELEEAENDARLMVQRLESQLDGTREMESLLSASLSQEQQLSREMTRKFREVQMMEKSRRMREETLEYENQQSFERAVSLEKDRDALAAQLSFAAYGLLLVQMWKKNDDNHMPGALVPYSAFTAMPFMKPLCNEHCNDVVLSSNDLCNLNNTKNDKLSISVVHSLNNSQTEINQNENDVTNSMEIEEDVIDGKIEEHNLRRSHSDEESETPAKKRLKSTMTRSTSTMTHLDELLSEREKYYLEQIEALQKEKMNLRKDQDVERSDSLQHYTDFEVELEELKEKLLESERDKCSLIFKLEEIEDTRHYARRDMQKRMDELKRDMNRNNDLFDMEKAALQRGYEARLQEVLEDRTRHESRVRELEQQLGALRHELEAVGGAIASDLAVLDTGETHSNVIISRMSEPYNKSSHARVFKTGEDGELLDKIRDLVKSESSLRHKIGELEKKESAYRETIEEADTIMSSHVTSYTRRIEELEGVIEQHMAKINQLQTSEERLRGALRTNSRNSDGERITELLDRVIETENSELKLKERVWTLERGEKELQIKLVEGEKVQQSLRSELRDQEELVHRLMSLQSENNLLSVELQQAHDSCRKMGDVQQSESYFRSRVEELEASENSLRDSLHQAEVLRVHRDRKLKEQNRLLEGELHSCRTQHENSSVKALEAREIEIGLRRQMEDLRNRLHESEKELKDSSSENMNHETQHRSEVTKLRNQLKLGNSQLTELDGLNCVLRDRITLNDGEKESITTELDDRIRRHEQDVLSLNLQISSRDSKVEELEGQLQQMRHSNAVGELDVLASTPLTSIHTALSLINTTIQGCEMCSVSQSGSLADIAHQLATLSELLEGHGTDCDSSDVIQSDLDTTSDMDETTPINPAENLDPVDFIHTNASPNLAGEGTNEHNGEDHKQSTIKQVNMQTNPHQNNLTEAPLNRRDLKRRSRRRIDDKARRRLQMPSTTGSVLDELEEKVRELEDVIIAKEEELKIADGEAVELSSKLQTKDEVLLKKAVESDHLNVVVSNLREQLMCTIEDYERSRLSLETKHKVDVEEIARRMEHLTQEVENLVSRGRLKDTIIGTLVSQIRSLLRSGNMSVIINQLRNLSKVTDVKSNDDEMESTTSPHIQKIINDHQQQTCPNVDFDIEKVCILLNQPHQEMQGE